MTKYQIIAVRDKARIILGDPHEFMSMAEIHAERIRGLLPEAEKIVLTVEAVSV